MIYSPKSFLFSSNVIRRNHRTPGRQTLDISVVNSSYDPEISIFTETSSPAVFNIPKWQPSFWVPSPTRDQNDVVRVLIRVVPQNSLTVHGRIVTRFRVTRLNPNPTVVVMQTISVHADCNRSVFKNFFSHQVFRGSTVVVSYVTVVSNLVPEARVVQVFRSAFNVGRVVRHARGVDDSEVLGVFTDQVRKTSVAALRISGARYDFLFGK